MRAWSIVAVVGIVASLAGLAMAEREPSRADRFEKKVRPLLAARCWQCHGPEKHKGGLRLDSAAAIDAGGESGPVVLPGKPAESRLITAVGYAGDLKMPPKKKLSDAEIADLTEWVRAGADWPGAAPPRLSPTPRPAAGGPLFTAEKKSFWAFQPPRDPVPPTVKMTGWPTSPIDRFILSALEKNGLAPAPPADRRTLLRRATFDLTGLPPTPEEVEAFLADQSPDAFATVVDRLLASPHYGERWGRHWLDLARYADSNGMDENVAYANAFRYRDYVIRAFNADKPYDQFVIEQIAGDQVASDDEVAQPRPAHRDRVSRDRAQDARRGRPGENGDGYHRRAGRYGRARVHGADDRLCPLPRPQVRPDPHGRLLLAGGDFQVDEIDAKPQGRRHVERASAGDRRRAREARGTQERSRPPRGQNQKSSGQGRSATRKRNSAACAIHWPIFKSRSRQSRR